ncbi:GNAT family N-acetyltransferase [Paenibacillus sp. PL91]|uniref:GNAT family N-acetyltransferase n=1 Tax=Paenibacillus sp. PL91 TaxID=2729538 RepID=UPI00145DCEB9|nr:GNAT family N-acetyltransferase [Paenibacillus sp. PL91]MBC9204920.1 GNAT family N-acetyltransferase [Paenibacillus sp. PL91]
MISVLPERWQSRNLVFRRLLENEITEMQHLYSGSQYISEWDGSELNASQIEHWYYTGDLPPGGVKENYCLFAVRLMDSNELIGILSVYHGYPKINSAYIVFLYICKDKQGQGFGKESEIQLSDELKKLGYKEIRANVAVKNWPAIRFWINAGFNGVSGIYGDKVHAANTFANLELFKIL